jgi:SAM-dependent methyltransferase
MKRRFFKGEKMIHFRKGFCAALIFIIVFMGLSVTAYAQKRLPDIHFEATPQDAVEAMLEMAKVTKDDVVYDLGCGDGRFVITAAKKYGARGVGIDIDPELIKECKNNAEKAGVADRVKFIEADLFKTDIRPATVVALYLLNELNVRLRPALFSQLKPGSRIVSYTFDMGDWEPDAIGKSRKGLFFYWVVPANVAGTWHWTLPHPAGDWKNDLIFDQEFQDVSGKVTLRGWPLKMRDLKLVGDQLSFRARYNAEGENSSLFFSGRVSGDTINGTLTVEGGRWNGTREWTAKRGDN